MIGQNLLVLSGDFNLRPYEREASTLPPCYRGYLMYLTYLPEDLDIVSKKNFCDHGPTNAIGKKKAKYECGEFCDEYGT